MHLLFLPYFIFELFLEELLQVIFRMEKIDN